MKRGIVSPELLAVAVVVVFAAAFASLGQPVASHRPAAVHVCADQLKQIQLAISMYAQDYDEILPDATTVGNLRDYTREHDRPRIGRCPGAPKGGYALGDNIAGRPLAELGQTAEVIATWEYDAGSGQISSLVHNEGSNLGYLDGHVKWLTGKDRVFRQYYEGPTYVRPGVETLARGIIPIPLTF